LEKLFNNPQNLFQEKINTVIKTDPTRDLIRDLIEIIMLKNCQLDDRMLPLVELYNLLGPQKFMEIAELCSDKIVKFPSKEQFREAIQIAICYYYRNYKSMSWDDIKARLEDQELSQKKMGQSLIQLQKFMNEMADRIEARLSRIQAKEKEESWIKSGGEK
jgi:hypothetical protein